MPHPLEHEAVGRQLDDEEAGALADAMGMFATASRLRLLWALVEGERTVEDLAEIAALTPSATSHQLRLLRQARLVAVRREGRNGLYRLYDHHVPELLAAMRHHHEHTQSYGAPAQADPVR